MRRLSIRGVALKALGAVSGGVGLLVLGALYSRTGGT